MTSSAEKLINQLHFDSRLEWRRWLEGNFLSESEAWLIYPKKSTGKPRIPYNDAVEEALCFGWIDSIIKTYDASHSMQRFSPRKPKSSYSQANKERLRWLQKHDLIHPTLRDSVTKAVNDAFVFPSDILKVIEEDPTAFKNYVTFSESYKRIRIAFIESARNRPEEFQKRLSNFISKTKANKLVPGYGGIEKYY